MVTDDRAAELASIARLGDLSFESAVFGHGRAISRRGGAAVPGVRRARLAVQRWAQRQVTRRTLSDEAKARGESLQEYLLDVLDREAQEIDNGRLLAEWPAGSAADEPQPIRFVALIHSERENAKAIR